MNYKLKLRIHKFYLLLREAMPVLILVMLIFFGASNIGLLRDTKRIAQDTRVIVAKQDDTLKAIEQLALDNKISGDELKDILTCMLVVPIEQRSAEVEENCRKQARANSDGTIQQQPTQTTPQSSNNGKKNSQPTTNGNNSPQEQEQANQNRGIIQRVNERIENLLGIGE